MNSGIPEINSSNNTNSSDPQWPGHSFPWHCRDDVLVEHNNFPLPWCRFNWVNFIISTYALTWIHQSPTTRWPLFMNCTATTVHTDWMVLPEKDGELSRFGSDFSAALRLRSRNELHQLSAHNNFHLAIRSVSDDTDGILFQQISLIISRSTTIVGRYSGQHCVFNWNTGRVALLSFLLSQPVSAKLPIPNSL